MISGWCRQFVIAWNCLRTAVDSGQTSACNFDYRSNKFTLDAETHPQPSARPLAYRKQGLSALP
jgi:hypothetical protein